MVSFCEENLFMRLGAQSIIMSVICAYILALFCKTGIGSVGIAKGSLNFFKENIYLRKICKVNVYS